MKRKKRKIQLWGRIVLASFILFCYVAVFFLSFLYIRSRKENINKPLYSYNINQSLNYKVNLYDNSFIDNTTIGSNEMYISELIKNIEINFMYDYSANINNSLTYTYEIVANINGAYQDSEEKKSVWKKKYQLLDLTETNINSSNFVINKNIILDFPLYKLEVESFKKKFGMALTTSLDIDLIVNINGDIGDEKLNKETITSLSIPLGVQAFSIGENYEKEINDNILSKELNRDKVMLFKIEIIAILFIFTIILSLLFFKEIFIFKEKNNYNKRLNRILKLYGEIIVELAAPLNYENYEVVDVKKMEEMIDLEGELRIPINFYEHTMNEYGEFTLLHNNILYRYILKEK